MNEIISIMEVFIMAKASRLADLFHAHGGFFADGDVHVDVCFGGDGAAIFGCAGDADSVDAFGEVHGQAVGGDGAASGVELRLTIDGPAFDFADVDGFAIFIAGEGAELHFDFAILWHGAGASVDDLGG